MLRGTHSAVTLSEREWHTHTRCMAGGGGAGAEGEINSSECRVWIITVVSRERRAAIVASPLRVSYHSLACHYSFKCCCGNCVCVCVSVCFLLSLFPLLFHSMCSFLFSIVIFLLRLALIFPLNFISFLPCHCTFVFR